MSGLVHAKTRNTTLEGKNRFRSADFRHTHTRAYAQHKHREKPWRAYTHRMYAYVLDAGACIWPVCECVVFVTERRAHTRARPTAQRACSM